VGNGLSYENGQEKGTRHKKKVQWMKRLYFCLNACSAQLAYERRPGSQFLCIFCSFWHELAQGGPVDSSKS
jgi:hypothetical protein